MTSRKAEPWFQKAARKARREARVLRLALADERVPRTSKWLLAAVAAYALSPIDLIPDFIPVLGYLDDLILVPLGIWLAFRLIPKEVLVELRRESDRSPDDVGKPDTCRRLR